ncbi:MAG TPA: hypothetical protein VMY35_00320 [Phycisphaerae bacterium]|nr:hypothetical protein [Phycisphaerae bacterium]
MANAAIDSEMIILTGNGLAGFHDYNIGVPPDGFTGATHHNVAAAVYPVGTMVDVYNKGNTGVAGGATFIYGKVGAQDETNVIAAKHLCAIFATTPVPYEFSNEVATDLGESVQAIVIALSAMTTSYYGWFWCAGVCPEEFVSGLGGTYPTVNTTVVIGAMAAGDLETAGTTAGEIGFEIPDADQEVIVGYALSADA